MNSTAPRKLSIGRIIGLGLLAIIVILALWNVIWRTSNNRAVARLEAAARQRGEPVTLKEFAAMYPRVADEDNIHRALMKVWLSEDAPYWTAFMNGTRPLPQPQSESFTNTLPLLGSDHFDYTNDLGANALAAIREFLPRKKAHMDAVREAFKLKRYSANYNFDQGYAMLIPEMAKLKREAQFFAVEALDAIAAKDNARAITAIGDIANAGNCLKDDPLVIGQLVRIACCQIAINTTERLLKNNAVTAAECARLEQIMAGMKPDDGMKRALIGERTLAWAIFDAPAAEVAGIVSPGPDQSGSGVPEYGIRLMRLAGMTSAEKRLMAETYEQVARTLSKPDYAATDELRDIFTDMEKKAKTFPPRILTAMLMPALSKAGEKPARFEAARRCVLTALAVERHRLAHQGALPASLDELGAAALADPFTTKPLFLKQTEHGYVIYSVGPDRKDNDAQLDSKKSEREFDIGFRVEHP